ncbi:MAG: DUF3102 domain-containing protein [Oscillibacter sp.]|nr:DUF3102 domain-containing protein [Oscillibacter sp.]
MTPEQLGGEIRLLTAQARRMALSYGIQIGYRLRVAHEKVGPHGWAEWLKAETEFSPAAASRFEKLYEGYGEDQGSLFGVGNKFPTLENISVSNALRLLAVPEEEREEVAAEVDAEHLSARELERAIRERDEARKQLEKAREETDRIAGERVELQGKLEAAEKRAADSRPYKEKLEAAESRIRELESRPVEVAVERDEEAIQKAAAEAKRAAEAAAKADMDKLRERLERAQKAQKKAEEEKERAIRESPLQAEKAKAEAERAKKEIDELRRKLASAESGAGEVAMLARMAQTNFAAAMDKIAAMQAAHPNVAAKMLTGMERIVEALGERIREARETPHQPPAAAASPQGEA